MSIYPALSCARHIRPGNTAACLCCGERRFLSAIGAVAHLESGNCSRLGQWNLQYFASYHSGISPKFPPQYAPIHWFSCSNIFLVSNLAAGIPPILFQSLAKELPRARESWARDLEFREPAQANAEISAADAYRWIWESLWRRQSLSMHVLWQNLCEIEQPDGTQTGQAWAGLARSRILSILSNRALDHAWRVVPSTWKLWWTLWSRISEGCGQCKLTALHLNALLTFSA